MVNQHTSFIHHKIWCGGGFAGSASGGRAPTKKTFPELSQRGNAKSSEPVSGGISNNVVIACRVFQTGHHLFGKFFIVECHRHLFIDHLRPCACTFSDVGRGGFIFREWYFASADRMFESFPTFLMFPNNVFANTGVNSSDTDYGRACVKSVWRLTIVCRPAMICVKRQQSDPHRATAEPCDCLP